MTKFNTGVVVIVLVTALSAAAYAAAPKGGAPHPGGGAPHVGAFHAGGRAFHAGGGPRIGGGRAIAHSFARPGGRGHVGHVGHAVNRTTVRGNRAVTARNHPTGTVSSSRNVARNANRNAERRTRAVRNALNSRSVTRTLRNTGALRNPHTRALITARAATAGLNHGRHGAHAWWQHRHGGFGWVGPLFWPFAYYDISDYALWGDGYDDAFWDYGYNDIYAGMFAPYGYDDLAGYLPRYAATNRAGRGGYRGGGSRPAPLAQMCGEDSSDIAGLPIDRVREAIQPNDAQRAALDELADASLKAARDIKAACPTDVAATAPTRFAAMQQRIEAMIAAVNTVQPPLEKFYGLLSDEQKARVTALGPDQRQRQAMTIHDCGAGQPGETDWPTAEIDRTVAPTEAQRARLVALQNAAAKAADILKASCPADTPLTPPARLAAVGKRLDAMLQAVKTVRPALDDFYGALSDEQKARFDALGLREMSQTDQPRARHAHIHRRHAPGIGGLLRHLIRSL